MSDTIRAAIGIAGLVGGLCGIVGAILVWRGWRR